MTWAMMIPHGAELFFLADDEGMLQIVVRPERRAPTRYTMKFDAIARLGPVQTEGHMLTVHRVTR